MDFLKTDSAFNFIIGIILILIGIIVLLIIPSVKRNDNVFLKAGRINQIGLGIILIMIGLYFTFKN